SCTYDGRQCSAARPSPSGFCPSGAVKMPASFRSASTLDVYAQLEQRAERSPGTAFDDLFPRAKRRLDETG
ncbi:MAG TPA: hypothetical protein VGM91_20190, partial [Conexibacter sp.]